MFKPIESSPQLMARIAGLIYLATIVTGMFGLGFVQSRLVIDGDATITAANILAHESLFRVGFACVLIGTACYVAVTALLYALLKAVNRTISLTAAFFSLTGCAVWGVGCVFDLFALGVLKDARDFSQFNPDQLPALALLFLKLNSESFAVGMAFFGVYCSLLGYLILRSTFLPRVVGLLVVAAGAGHLISMFATFLAPASTGFLFPYIMIPGVVGEVGLALWLVLFGVNRERWNEQAVAMQS